jgi:hypothetical protein
MQRRLLTESAIQGAVLRVHFLPKQRSGIHSFEKRTDGAYVPEVAISSQEYKSVLRLF